MASKQEAVVAEVMKNHHVTTALNHINFRRILETLLARRAALTKEIEELDAAILEFSGGGSQSEAPEETSGVSARSSGLVWR